MKRGWGALYAGPVTLWLMVFFIAPLAVIVSYSVMTRGVYGGVRLPLSLDAYAALANRVFVKVTASTLVISLATTVIAVGLALPAAYFIARSRRRRALLLLVIIPFWTNFLVRIYAWIAILGNNGFLNALLLRTGIISEHVQFLYCRSAVILVLVYTGLPFAILPLYAAIEKFDFTLLEAARDLGASKAQAHVRVLLPNIRSGITTAVLFTFIPAFGSYAVPQLVGGTDAMMLGTIVARELTVTRNWPLASSISIVLTVLTTLAVVLFVRANRSMSDQARRHALPRRTEARET